MSIQYGEMRKIDICCGIVRYFWMLGTNQNVVRKPSHWVAMNGKERTEMSND